MSDKVPNTPLGKAKYFPQVQMRHFKKTTLLDTIF